MASERTRTIVGKGEGGFTLLEMMVALSIFSLAALSLMKLQSYSLATAADVEAKALAQLTAENIAADFMSNPAPLADGQQQGEVSNGGRRWRYSATIGNSTYVGVKSVSVTVRAADGGSGTSTLRFSRLAELR